MLPDESVDARIMDATPDHDESVTALSREASLRVDPAAHRAQDGSILLVCVTGSGTVLGFVSGRILLTEMEVFDLAVASQVRRRGVGSSLLGELLGRAADAGVRDVFLEVRASNAAAHALYLGLGFSRMGTRSRYYSDGEDATLFRCCLTPSP